MHFSSFSILATLAITTSFLPPLSIVTTIKNKFSSKNKMVEPKDGYYFLKSPHTIKDPETAGNIGLLPRGPAQPLALRIANLMDRLDSLTTDLDKYCLLHSILETDATLYFGTILRDVQKIMPLVYTPTVGEACVNYSKIHTNQPKGIYLSKYDKGNIATILRNWPFASKIKVICVTDGERILGLGDLGCNGMGIPVGKLALYTALGGVEPEGTLPMHIDFGCNVDTIRDDPLYMGLKEKRPSTFKTIQEYDEFMEEFFEAIKEVYGHDCMVQFEDFGNGNAFRFLDMFKDKHICFNDDIQGTASVALGGIMASLRITEKLETGAKALADHTFLFMGAGEAGCGIAGLIGETIQLETGCSQEEAYKNIWLVDSSGLVTSRRDMKRLPHHKHPFAHEPPAAAECDVGDVAVVQTDRDCVPASFIDAVRLLKPTTIVGVSGQPQVFTQEVIELMTKNNEAPIIFSLSNPTSKSECTADQAYLWSGGKAIFASGSPFPEVEVNGQKFRPAQGNNAYIFPGIGLGAIFCGATRLDDLDMICASRTLANLVPQEMLDMGAVFPDLKTAREVSVKIAVEVARGQWERGTALKEQPPDDKLETEIRHSMYHARKAHANMFSAKNQKKPTFMEKLKVKVGIKKKSGGGVKKKGPAIYPTGGTALKPKPSPPVAVVKAPVKAVPVAAAAVPVAAAAVPVAAAAPVVVPEADPEAAAVPVAEVEGAVEEEAEKETK